MGIAAYFKKKIADSTEIRELNNLAKQIETSVVSEKRIYPRYDFSYITNATVQFSNGIKGTIKDISYSGIAVSLNDPSEINKIEKNSSFVLTVLGESTPAQATLIYSSQSWCGFFFQHTDLSALVFLRKIMEAFRCGASMSVIDPALVQEKYKGGDWFVLRGEGPVDLFLQVDKNSENSIKQFLLIFLDGNVYRHVRFENGELFTAEAVDKGDAHKSLSARMQNHATPNRDLIRKAIFLLSAVNEAKLTPYMQVMLDSLRSRL